MRLEWPVRYVARIVATYKQRFLAKTFWRNRPALILRRAGEAEASKDEGGLQSKYP
jgi:hypothetical protein